MKPPLSITEGLRFGPLPARTIHLCVDMQRMFAEATPWRTPWMERVLPVVVRLCAARPRQTWFTRFIPAAHPGGGRGTWRRYWHHWPEMTRKHLPPEMIALLPELQGFTPPARQFDKPGYSPWRSPAFRTAIRQEQVEAVVVSGAETDMCVLATILGAVDRGLRTVAVTDALCGSSDHTHDAVLDLYRERYGQQIETAAAEEVLRGWPDSGAGR